jgi:hypothetical protein
MVKLHPARFPSAPTTTKFQSKSPADAAPKSTPGCPKSAPGCRTSTSAALPTQPLACPRFRTSRARTEISGALATLSTPAAAPSSDALGHPPSSGAYVLGRATTSLASAQGSELSRSPSGSSARVNSDSLFILLLLGSARLLGFLELQRQRLG